MSSATTKKLTQRTLRAAFVQRGRSYAEIARQLRVTRQAVSNVAQGRKGTPRIRRALARAAGLSLDALNWRKGE